MCMRILGLNCGRVQFSSLSLKGHELRPGYRAALGQQLSTTGGVTHVLRVINAIDAIVGFSFK